MKEIFLAIWSGGLEQPAYAAYTSREAAAVKTALAWLPDLQEGDDITILRIQLDPLEIEDLNLSPGAIAIEAHDAQEA